MIPAFSNVWTLRRLTHGMQLKLARKFLERVIILPHRRARLQPFRLLLWPLRREVNLHEFGCGCGHVLLFYDASRRIGDSPLQRVQVCNQIIDLVIAQQKIE